VELIVFDLDGTLLNGEGKLSPVTRETLEELSQRGVSYTVATGRTLHASQYLLDDLGFSLPHVYKNGVMIWDPATGQILHQNYLTTGEIGKVLQSILQEGLAAFIFTLEDRTQHRVFHTPASTAIEHQLIEHFSSREGLVVRPVAELPAEAEITNISTVGEPESIARVNRMILEEAHLVGYSGNAWDGESWRWLDIHHANASKGGAIDLLKTQLGVSRVVCFGDSENDLSMFERADESYAPSNAEAAVRQAATAVIGDHDEDGIARFLRERFGLDG
jgi:Cof subfamily protein (haloacid dehalogenase superfamily)